MNAAIILAFLSILLPGIIVFGGVWFLARRERSRKAAQDREHDEQDTRAAGMAAMSRPRALRVVPPRKQG